MSNILIKQRSDESIESILSFYQSVGYEGGAQEEDYFLLALEDSQIIGVVRISQENSYPILRGMFLSESQRGNGLGSKMLKELEVYLDSFSTPCLCIPHDHLENFYQQIGFKVLSFKEAPDFLSQRAQSYQELGHGVLLMQRQPH